MPWTVRPSHGRERIRQGLRRWRYDHSEPLLSWSIGAGVVAAALLIILIMNLVG